MPAYDLEEQEQIAAIKDWWRRYGNAVSIIVTAASIGVLIWTGWQYYQNRQASEAGVLYGAIELALTKNEAPKIKDAADQLVAKFPGTGYAPRGELLAAKQAFDAGDREGAKARLQWVIEHAKEDSLKQLARLRLATVFLDENKFDQALQILDSKHDDAMDGLYSDLKGDVLAAAGKTAEARAAYQQALVKLDAKSPYRSYVQVKLDAYGGGDK